MTPTTDLDRLTAERDFALAQAADLRGQLNAVLAEARKVCEELSPFLAGIMVARLRRAMANAHQSAIERSK